MSAPLGPLTPDRVLQQGSSFAWAYELRAREHAAGLGSPDLTEFQRGAWREVLAHELTDEERATAPRRLTGRIQQRRGR